MPTSTIPFEVVLEFTNDLKDSATLRLLRRVEDEFDDRGAMILLHSQESVSLVLDAGSTYHYALKQNHRRVHITVKVWRDIKINAKHIFDREQQETNQDGRLVLPDIEGITITPISTLSRRGSRNPTLVASPQNQLVGVEDREGI